MASPCPFDPSLFPSDVSPPEEGKSPAPVVIGRQRYQLRGGVPRRFKTQVVFPDPEVSEEDCAQRYVVSARDLLEALKSRVKVQRKTLDIFTHQMEFDYVGAALDPEQAARLAPQAHQRFAGGNDGGSRRPREGRAFVERHPSN